MPMWESPPTKFQKSKRLTRRHASWPKQISLLSPNPVLVCQYARPKSFLIRFGRLLIWACQHGGNVLLVDLEIVATESEGMEDHVDGGHSKLNIDTATMAN